jgi:WD40 repeat protein
MATIKTNDTLATLWQSSLEDHVIDLAWSPDGRFLAAAAVSGPVAVLDGRSGAQRSLLPGHGLGTMALSWHPNSRLLATSGQDGKARLWDVEEGRQTAVLEGGAAWVERVAWSAPSQQQPPVLASAAGRTLRFWDESGGLVRQFADASSTIADIAWKPGRKTLAAAAYGGIQLYRPDQEAPVALLPWQGSSLALAWSPDGEMLATGDQDSTVHFWYVRKKQDLQMWGYPTKVRELAWDRKGRYLATGGGSIVTIWDCGGKKGPEGSRPQQLRLHEDALTVLAYQATGDRLLSAGQDGLIAVWQPRRQSRPLAMLAMSAGVSRACWAPDDRWLAVGAADGRIAALAQPA